jgi:hypothetical protein
VRFLCLSEAALRSCGPCLFDAGQQCGNFGHRHIVNQPPLQGASTNTTEWLLSPETVLLCLNSNIYKE